MTVYNKRRARRSIFHTATYRALSQVATILGTIVLVRGLSEHEYGIFSVLYSIMPVISSLGSLGLEQTLRRYQPEYLQAGNSAASTRLLTIVSTTRFIANVVLLGIMLATWSILAPVFQLGDYRHEFLLFCAVILFYFQGNVLQLSLASHMLHHYSVGAMALMAVAKLVGYLIFWRTTGLTLESAIGVDIAATALFFLGLYTGHKIHCRAKGIDAFRFDPEERRRLLRYSLFNSFNDAGTLSLNSRTDNLFIAALADAHTTGTYAFYTRLALMFGRASPVRMFGNVAQPMLFSIPREDATRRLPGYFTAMLDIGFLVQLPVTAYVTAYHHEIVQVVFGGRFIEYSWLMPVVFWFSAVNVIAEPVTLMAQYAEKAAVLLRSKIFGIYNVVAMIALVPLFGSYGAAFASGTAQIMKNTFIWWHVRDIAHWLNAPRVIAYAFGIWGGAILLCYGLKIWLTVPPVVHLAIGACVCAAAGFAYIRSPAVSKPDRDIIGSILRGREARLLSWLGVLPRKVGERE